MRTFIGVDFGSKPSFTTVVIMCAACQRQVATGIISYMTRVHEPHCDACCKDWSRNMQNSALQGVHSTLQEFREWQAYRRSIT